MTPDPYTLARGNAARRAYEGATTMTQQRRFTPAEMTTEARRMDPDSTAAKMLRQGADDAAIVEQLPITTDGKRIIPGVTRVWINPGEPGGFFYDAGYDRNAPPMEVKVGACWGDHFWFTKDGEPDGDNWAGKSWSTRAAAEAAIRP